MALIFGIIGLVKKAEGQVTVTNISDETLSFSVSIDEEILEEATFRVYRANSY